MSETPVGGALRALVVEDEDIVARRLMRLAGRILGAEARIDHSASLGSARRHLAERPVDLLFLDLDLEGADGFALLAEAAAGSFDTIVVSARTERALTAFEYGVVDFVPKPYTEERLAKAIARAREPRRRRAADRRERLKYLAVRAGSEVRPVPVETILFVRGAGDYSELHCADGATHLHAKTLTALAELLPPPFLRVHRSFIARLDRVSALESAPGSRYRLRLEGGAQLPVSRRRVRELRRRLGG